MAKFITSVPSVDLLPQDETPEVLFIGRSNVGKSSLINAIANEDIAFTSKTPGRTQMLNLYNFKSFRLVDSPGYGFAKVSKTQKKEFNSLLSSYITQRNNLRGVFVILDASIITPLDYETITALLERFRDVVVVANKIDKLNRNDQKNLPLAISKYLQIDQEAVCLVSAKQGANVSQVMNLIKKVI